MVKSYGGWWVVGGGGDPQDFSVSPSPFGTNYQAQGQINVSPGPGLWSLVLGPFGPDLGPDLDLTWTWT